MSSQAASKKRKRAPSPERLTFSTARTSYTPGTNVPVLLSFPGVEAPQDTAFKCYAHKKSNKSKNKEKEREDSGPSSAGMIVVGETDDMEFFSNESENQDVDKAGCRYLIAVHNKRDSTLKLLPTTTPVHILKQKVKALKSVAPSSAPSGLTFFEARNALGESFGTKKAKASIRAVERNKVDITSMENVMDYVMDGIDRGAKDLPTKDEAKIVADTNRLIPRYNEATTDPDEIYLLHDIVPENEWKAISSSPFDQAQSVKERMALFPFKNSEWIHWHIKGMHGKSLKKSKTKLKIIYCVSVMLAFRRVAGTMQFNRAKVEDHLKGVPSDLVEGLLSRFTEQSRGSTEHHVTMASSTKLLTHLLALCLKADGFVSDSKMLSKDLQLDVTQVKSLFKSLGCTFKKLTGTERTKFGYSEDKSNTAMAVLTAPVKFPNVAMRKKGGRK